MSGLVASAGIEPASSESESEILSIEIRSQNTSTALVDEKLQQYGAKIRKACRAKNNISEIEPIHG